MRKSATWIALSFALLSVAGCQMTAPASDCDGWSRLSPSAETRSFIVANDMPFAQEVAAYIRHGQNRGCWR